MIEPEQKKVEARTSEEQEVEVQRENVEAALALAREEFAKLEEKLKAARGSSDVTTEAQVAVAEAAPKTLSERIEEVLRVTVLATDELATTLGESPQRVRDAIKVVRAQVANVGTADRARWSWRVGTEAQPRELRDLIERLIADQPMTFREVVNATGSRDGLVQGALVDIRRSRTNVVDLGVGSGKSRWFMLPTDMRDATLRRRRGHR